MQHWKVEIWKTNGNTHISIPPPFQSQTSTHNHIQTVATISLSAESLGGGGGTLSLMKRQESTFIHIFLSGALVINRGSADIIAKDQISIKCIQLSWVLMCWIVHCRLMGSWPGSSYVIHVPSYHNQTKYFTLSKLRYNEGHEKICGNH
jgi:hypothetical protein